MENRNQTLKKIIISAVMIAVGTVLSLFKFEGLWILGGGVTFCAMLPLVVVSHRYGVRWGLWTALIFGILQALFGLDNIQYASSFFMAIQIILLDYLLAYGVIGFSGFLREKIKSKEGSLVAGIWVTFCGRFFCHFFSGWLIWDALWPNEIGMLSPIYSFLYNGSYMLPEAVLTSLVAVLIQRTTPKVFQSEDFFRGET